MKFVRSCETAYPLCNMHIVYHVCGYRLSKDLTPPFHHQTTWLISSRPLCLQQHHGLCCVCVPHQVCGQPQQHLLALQALRRGAHCTVSSMIQPRKLRGVVRCMRHTLLPLLHTTHVLHGVRSPTPWPPTPSVTAPLRSSEPGPGTLVHRVLRVIQLPSGACWGSRHHQLQQHLQHHQHQSRCSSSRAASTGLMCSALCATTALAVRLGPLQSQTPSLR